MDHGENDKRIKKIYLCHLHTRLFGKPQHRGTDCVTSWICECFADEHCAITVTIISNGV
jgi:hypothetical protein